MVKAGHYKYPRGTNARDAVCLGMQWIEVLINLLAFAGFIGIASHSSRKHRADK
ncbi:hypothetical protein [Bradyrhizobium sp. dw_78]|uniref:hypothetical protein n=1 Tax=Bradyrhizobium sp. dw_78 TaxID=2719793 RepID=UPI001BD43BA1|nr:hypothetical protein [Bradyrhizobium sp. dw_78]